MVVTLTAASARAARPVRAHRTFAGRIARFPARRARARARSSRITRRFPATASAARATPPPVTEVDEKQAFRDLMERAGVKHQVRLASGPRGRGLFVTGTVGWNRSDVLLSVPLDACIVAPFGDADAGAARVAAEFGIAGGGVDTLVTLRRAWETRNGVKIPRPIVDLLDSPKGDDRELAIALWLLWSLGAGDGETNLWRSYGEWLPTPAECPSLLLASPGALAQLQDERLASAARAMRAASDAANRGVPGLNAAALDAGAAPGPAPSDDDLAWAFALVASRALASPVGESGGGDAAILVPFFDMANHDDASAVTAIKSVRGTEDADVRAGARVAVEKALNQGVGGPRVVLETTRGMVNAQQEVIISYDPTATNAELMLRYGFSLRGNRNDRLPSVPGGAEKVGASARCLPAPMRCALEARGVMTETLDEDERRRVACAVASACGGSAAVSEEDEAWELDESDVARELAAAEALGKAWADALAAKEAETTLEEDEALLSAANAPNGIGLPGADARVVAAIEYRAEAKRALRAGTRACDAYAAWLREEEEEGEGEEEEGEGEEGGAGFIDQDA